MAEMADVFAGAAGWPVVVGGGLGGMLCALELAPLPCLLLTRAALGTEGSTGWAQGGIAAAVGPDDSPASHAADTLAAGDGLCDPDAVRRMVEAGPAVVALLERYGVRFDRAPDGTLALGLEAAHGRHRIVHASGDATGAEIVRALAAAVRSAPSIRVVERAVLVELARDRAGAVVGAGIERDGRRWVLPTGAVVLATGGIGGLFRDTTNPLGAVGSGLAIAARAGAALGELEFVQFHPTALAAGAGMGAGPGAAPIGVPMSLVSEAVRGEGAVLVDETGERFTDELAPRDVVSRAVWRHGRAGHAVFLDARAALGERFAARFPGIDRLCRARGVDPGTMPIPVRPAAHYHMGGIVVDAAGRSTVPGLFAVGECACTGLHGANRLASNSLLEAAVGAMAAARAIGDGEAGAPGGGEPVPAARGAARPAGELAAVRTAMARAAGVERDGAELARAIALLRPLAEADDAALVALMVCVAAHRREESRGGHFRADRPAKKVSGVRSVLRMDEALAYRPEAVAERRLAS